MTKFVEVEQDGKTATVNPDNVFAVLPNQLINTSNIVSIAGVSLPVKGGVQEITLKLSAEDPVGESHFKF